MDDAAVKHEPTRAADFRELAVSSPAFQAGGPIPTIYTCDGINSSPPLAISGIPGDARSLVLIAEDPDAPRGTWLHWMVWDIPVTHLLHENEIHGVQGKNDFGDFAYGGPCPPSGTHRYFFKVYALDNVIGLPPETGRPDLERAISGHILGFGELIGTYSRRQA